MKLDSNLVEVEKTFCIFALFEKNIQKMFEDFFQKNEVWRFLGWRGEKYQERHFRVSRKMKTESLGIRKLDTGNFENGIFGRCKFGNMDIWKLEIWIFDTLNFETLKL